MASSTEVELLHRVLLHYQGEPPLSSLILLLGGDFTSVPSLSLFYSLIATYASFFGRVIITEGNHELWSTQGRQAAARSEGRPKATPSSSTAPPANDDRNAIRTTSVGRRLATILAVAADAGAHVVGALTLPPSAGSTILLPLRSFYPSASSPFSLALSLPSSTLISPIDAFFGWQDNTMIDWPIDDADKETDVATRRHAVGACNDALAALCHELNAPWLSAVRARRMRGDGSPLVTLCHMLPRQELLLTRSQWRAYVARQQGAADTRGSAGRTGTPPRFNFSEVAGDRRLDTNARAALSLTVSLFGHSHRGRDRVIDGVRYVSHPRGYAHEREGGASGTSVIWSGGSGVVDHVDGDDDGGFYAAMAASVNRVCPPSTSATASSASDADTSSARLAAPPFFPLIPRVIMKPPPIPSISLYPLLTHHSSHPNFRAAAARLHDAAATSGFFFISDFTTNDFLPCSWLEQVDQVARDFFALSTEAKGTVGLREERGWRGWSCVGSEETLGVPDHHECLDLAVDYTEGEAAEAGLHLLARRNPAELESLVPGSTGVLARYMAKLSELGNLLLCALDVGGGGDGHYWDDYFAPKAHGLLRLLRYPRPERECERVGVGEHTDYGFLTILRASAPGLRVRRVAAAGGVTDDWLDVPPLADRFIVNLGDMLALSSTRRPGGGKPLRATPHMVQDVPVERYSFAYFHEPSLTARVTGEQQAHPAEDNASCSQVQVVYGDYLLNKYRKAYPTLCKNA